jgi:hypothetical protein
MIQLGIYLFLGIVFLIVIALGINAFMMFRRDHDEGEEK